MQQDAFIVPLEIRWADLDPNFHVRHSVYYDWGAHARTQFLYAHGLDTQTMQRLQVGPVLFREEAIFRREIHFGDKISIIVRVSKLRRDMSRFSFRHEIVKEDGTLCATLNVDGAWISLETRKLTSPPEKVLNTISHMPTTDDFVWEEAKA